MMKGSKIRFWGTLLFLFGIGTITGYGQSGPFARAAGHDINYLARSGIAYAAGRKQGRRNRGAAVAGLVVCALTVLEEFMLDGKITWGEYGLPPVVIYGAMAWGLLELAAFEHAARRKLDIA